MNFNCLVVPLADLLPDLDASIRYKEVLGRDVNAKAAGRDGIGVESFKPSYLHLQREHGRRKGLGITV